MKRFLNMENLSIQIRHFIENEKASKVYIDFVVINSNGKVH